MKIRLNHFPLLAILAIAPIAANADVLMLKDGQAITGKFMGADQSSVSFSANGQVRQYSISQINSITFTPTQPDNSSLPLPTARGGTQTNAQPGAATAPVTDPMTAPSTAAATASISTPAPVTPTTAGYPSPAATTNPAPAKKLGYTVHAGSVLTIRMIDPVDSATDQMGQSYRASLDEPVMIDGSPVVPRGADVTVKLTSVQEAGRIAGRSTLSLVLFDITVQGQKYELTTSEVTQSGSSRGKQTATRVGIGTALGAAIGAIAGGGKGAAIGAATGAGAGGAIQVMTKGEQVKVPSETRLEFTLAQPLNL